MANDNIRKGVSPLLFGKIHFVYLILFIILSCFILVINLKAPLVGEDIFLQPWRYAGKPDSLVESGSLIFGRIIHQAKYWSPRIGEALTILTGAFPPALFDVINSAVFIYLGILIFVFGFGRFPRWNNVKDCFGLLLVYFLFIVVFPFLGQVFFWKAGTASHVWGLAILLGFALPYRLHLDDKPLKRMKLVPYVLFCLLGVAAGLSIETGLITVACLLVILYIYKVLTHHKITFKGVVPILFLFLGGSILLFSPATTYRRQYYSSVIFEDDLKGISLLIFRAKKILPDYFYNSWIFITILFILTLILLIIFIRDRKLNSILKNLTHNQFAMLISLAISFLGISSLFMIAYQSDQARAIAINHFFILSIIVVVAQKLFFDIPQKIIKGMIVLVCSIVLVISMINIYEEYCNFNAQVKLREVSIAEQIESGIKDLKLQPLNVMTTRAVETREMYFIYNLTEMFPDYYGVNSITLVNDVLSVGEYLPNESISYYFDALEINEINLQLRGWMFIKGVNSKDVEKLIMLKEITGNRECFYSTTTESKRLDVSRTFNGNYDLSGFSSSIDLTSLASGTYQIGVVMKSDGQYFAVLSEQQIEVN